MFIGCSNISEIDMSNFDTSSVTAMSSMFQGGKLLTSIKLENVKTSQVKLMYRMFEFCSSLSS